MQGGKEATRALPSGHKASWLTTPVPGGLLAGRKGCGARKAPGVPFCPQHLAPWSGRQEIASGGTVQASALVIWEGDQQVEEGLSSWETTLVAQALGHKVNFLEQTLGALQ